MNRNKQLIKLTEQDLHFLVENTVYGYLIQEGIFNNVLNGTKNVVGGAWDAAKAAGNTVGALYYNSAANGQIQKLQQVKKQYENKIEQIQQQIKQLQQKAQTKQQNAQGNMQSLKNRMQSNTNYNKPQQKARTVNMNQTKVA